MKPENKIIANRALWSIYDRVQQMYKPRIEKEQLRRIIIAISRRIQ